MQVKEIYVEAAFTKSLPNYQNVKPMAGVRITLDPHEDVKEVYKAAWDMVGQQIKSQLDLFEEEKKGVKRGL